MNDLKLAALNLNPATPASPARGLAATDGAEGLGSFGDAMAQATTRGATAAKSAHADERPAPQTARRDSGKPAAREDEKDPAAKKEDVAAEAANSSTAENPAAVAAPVEPVTEESIAAAGEPAAGAASAATSGAQHDLEQLGALAASVPGAALAAHEPSTTRAQAGSTSGGDAKPSSDAKPIGTATPGHLSAQRADGSSASGLVAENNAGAVLRRETQATIVETSAAAHERPASKQRRIETIDDAGERRDLRLARMIETLTAQGERAAAVKDRLIEDFQQRFERALSGVALAAPRSDAGILHSAAAPAWTGANIQQPNGAMTIAVPTPVTAAGFNEDFSQRIALLARGKVHTAEISLTPADLGPISVSIEVRGQEASLVFGAAHASTRAAIEEALPRLRDMLGSQGLQLTDARVGTGDQPQRESNHPQRHVPNPAGDGVGSASAPASAATNPVPTAVQALRLIDVIV